MRTEPSSGAELNAKRDSGEFVSSRRGGRRESTWATWSPWLPGRLRLRDQGRRESTPASRTRSPLHHRYITVTSTIRPTGKSHQVAVASPLHHRYITVTSTVTSTSKSHQVAALPPDDAPIARGDQRAHRTEIGDSPAVVVGKQRGVAASHSQEGAWQLISQVRALGPGGHARRAREAGTRGARLHTHTYNVGAWACPRVRLHAAHLLVAHQPAVVSSPYAMYLAV